MNVYKQTRGRGEATDAFGTGDCEREPHHGNTDSARPGYLRRRDVRRGAGGCCPRRRSIRNVVAEAVLADELGLDFIGVGEHHRDDFAVSAPEVVLAAIAGQTKRIRLGSAVTVLSSDDPVRVFERFSTLDAVSGGRAEVIVGRGSFTESFPLFGYPLDQYEQLFEEKLDLFAELLQAAAGHLVRADPRRADRPDGVSADRVRLAHDLGRPSAAARSRWCGRRATDCR